MSGHSKWSTIKSKKGALDAKRGKLFTKLTRAIIIAAREGGPDPDANVALANAIAKARSYSMPKDNIERAITRATGAGEGSDAYEPISYEGYGPDGVAIIVEALTDNRNRTAADVRSIFASTTCSLAQSMVAAVRPDGHDRNRRRWGRQDEPTLAAADVGAEDVHADGGVFRVTTMPADLGRRARDGLEAAGSDRVGAHACAKNNQRGSGGGPGAGSCFD